jgi:creatinine amidohydrolase/Fe(II)-dependent formamide hydrolase-like protein
MRLGLALIAAACAAAPVLTQVPDTVCSCNPARATAEYGKQILKMQIDAAVRQIRALRESSRR